MDKPLALIIEDDNIVAQMFELALQDVGYETEIILNGSNAMERLAETKPELIILDLRLPNVSGVTILVELRKDERLADTRVIVVSADATLTGVVRESADLVLIKPVGFNQLTELAARLRKT